MSSTWCRFLLSWTFVFLVPGFGWAQGLDSSSEIPLNESSLAELLGAEWKGVLLLCKPYCSPVSRRKDGVWTPALTGEVVKRSWVKPVAEADPLFPLLIQTEPPLNGVIKKEEKPPQLPPRPKAQREPKKRVPPKYAKMPFDYGWEFDMGFQALKRTVESDTAIQSDIEPDSMVTQISLRAGLMKGSPNYLWGQWFQNQLFLNYNMKGSAKSQDGVALGYSSLSLQYQMWLSYRKFKMGPRLHYLSESVTSETNSLSHSSTTMTGYLLGWGFLWRHWNLFADAMLMGDIKDKTSFRNEPFDQSYYRFGVEYCSKELNLFDMGFGLCGSLSYVMDQQTSGLADNLLLGSSSTVDSSSIFLRLSIRFGEDFY